MALEKSILKGCLSISTGPKDPIWQVEFNLSDPTFCEILYTTRDKEINEAANRNPDAAFDIGLTIMDALDNMLINATSEEGIVLLFFRFLTAAQLADLSLSTGYSLRAIDFLFIALNGGRTYESTKSWKFETIEQLRVSDHPFVQDLIRGAYLTWIKCLYYYSWTVGGAKEVCSTLLEFTRHDVRKIINTNRNNVLAVSTYCHVLAWMIKNDSDLISDSVAFLEELYNDETISATTKKTVVMQLAILKDETTKSRSDWVAILLRDFKEYLQGHDELQLLGIMSEENPSGIKENTDSILNAIDRYFKEVIPDFGGRRTQDLYEKLRLFDLIGPTILNLILQGDCATACAIVSRFVNSPNQATPPILPVFIISSEAGLLMSHNGSSMTLVDGNHIGEKINKLNDAANKCLGMKIIFNHPDGSALIEPDREGIPQELGSDEFERNLDVTFQFEKIAEFMTANKIETGKSAFIHIAGMSYPFQAAMIKKTGMSLPIITSYREPNSFRELKRVVVVASGTYTSELESSAITEIFRAKGIILDRADVSTLEKKKFLEIYGDPKYDICWLAVHGLYDVSDPHKSYIQINDKLKVTIDDMAGCELKDQKRRLLVLNACDTGKTTARGSLSVLGFGASMSSESQAVISHLWPIGNYPALAFGVLLSIHLANGKVPWDAFSSTISNMSKGKEAIINELNNTKLSLEEVADRVNNTNVGYTNIVNWGSPVFYQ